MNKINGSSVIPFIGKKAIRKKENESQNAVNTLKNTSSSDKFISSKKKKSGFFKKVLIFLSTIGAAAFAFLEGRNIGYKKAINELDIPKKDKTINEQQKQLEALRKEHDELEKISKSQQEVIENKQAQIEKITDLLENLSLQGENQTIIKNRYKAGFLKLLESNPNLEYDPMATPESIASPGHSYRKKIKVSHIKPFITPPKPTANIVDTSKLKEQYKNQGNISLVIPGNKEIDTTLEDSVSIGSKQIENLGKTVECDFTTSYGKRINWSDKKIARDIMQNFYDGQGNTLDGVSISMQKLPNGANKIKISGNSYYNYKDLQLFGAGNKEENPYNAGGFGEGAKILVANMLGKGDASNITFSCADWRLTFSAPKEGNIVQRTLEKSESKIQGNTIEFETQNQELVDALIDSINFFEHSKNPDFQNLTYDSKDFAFRFKENGSGNIYLIQRFEFGHNGAWDNCVENLDIIYKRKPDPEKYYNITGEEFPKDRDRTYLTGDDIRNLTRYFVNSMYEEKIASCLLATRSVWEKITDKKFEKSAILPFIKGLVDELDYRNIALDFGEEKIVAYNGMLSEPAKTLLLSYGYSFVPSFFSQIGIKNDYEVLKNMSQHKAIQPNETEIKKLKLLEEGVSIIQERMLKAQSEYMKNAKISINPNIIKDFSKQQNIVILTQGLSEYNSEISKFLSKYIYFSREDLNKMSKEEYEQLCKILSNTINETFKKLSDSTNTDKVKEFTKTLCTLLISNDKTTNEAIITKDQEEYLRTIYDLNLITKEDIKKPRYLFDRKSELATNTLGEAICDSHDYKGHWVDKEYLDTSDFTNLLGTWIHEICHKSGGDGSAQFTYALTDVIKMLIGSLSGESIAKLNALKEIFNELK